MQNRALTVIIISEWEYVINKSFKQTSCIIEKLPTWGKQKYVCAFEKFLQKKRFIKKKNIAIKIKWFLKHLSHCVYI